MSKMDESLVYEVIEINAMGDHTIVGRYSNLVAANVIAEELTHWCEEPYTSYYVNDIREEY
jgi:hypothetical protein